MKTAIFFAITLFSLISKANDTYANQPGLVFTHFTSPITFAFIRGTQTGHGYNLQWKLSASAGVKNLIIESTYEDPADPYSVWQTKAVVGITNGVNKFSDQNTLPGIINYRITTIANDNSTLAVSDIFTDIIQ